MKHQHSLYPMLSVEEALEKILKVFNRLEPVKVPILESLGRILAEDILAKGDIPPHANTAMDGYAVIASDTAGAQPESPVELTVIENLAAGYVAKNTLKPGTAIRIMTGAPIPEGADAVIPFEETHQKGEVVTLFSSVEIGKNVRYTGEDVKAGELILKAGKLIRPQEIGMLAALGYAVVNVIRRPKIAILATGDELVPVEETLTPGKIRNTNEYSNAAQVLKYGGLPIRLGIARDNITDLTNKIQYGLTQGADLLLTSGGVSVGDFDVVKQVLVAEGKMTFWRVRMKPGKPLAFGVIRTERNGIKRTVPVLGMPGNPVSAMVSFELFVRPAIYKMSGFAEWQKPTFDVILDDPIVTKDSRRHYVRVEIHTKNGNYHAKLTGDQGSGILNSMVVANGLAIIPEDWTNAKAGSRVKAMWLD